MRRLHGCLFACALGVALPAQVTDVGLTMSGAAAGIMIGQSCGPLACSVFQGGTIGFGQSRILTHFGAPSSFFAIAIGFPNLCWQIPGIANDFLLVPPIETLAAGVVNLPALTAVCRQGLARTLLTMPPAGPVGITFRVQSLGVSNTGVVAFGPAIEATLQ